MAGTASVRGMDVFLATVIGPNAVKIMPLVFD